MTDMKKLQWLKRDGILQDAQATYLLSKGDGYYITWLLIQDVAAAINDEGKIYISPQTPMDVDFLAKYIRRPKRQVETTLELLAQLALIRRDDQGFIQLLTWADLQDYDRLERQRRQTRERVAAYRKRQAEEQGAGDVAAPIAPAELTADNEAVRQYQAYWGEVNPVIARKLQDLTAAWGSEAVCAAMAIAYENDTNNVNYMKAILLNSNGRPKRKENSHERWEREIDQSFDQVFYPERCRREYRETPAHAGSPAGHESGPGTGTENPPAQTV